LSIGVGWSTAYWSRLEYCLLECEAGCGCVGGTSGLLSDQGSEGKPSQPSDVAINRDRADRSCNFSDLMVSVVSDNFR
jgi:hypothetical protein